MWGRRANRGTRGRRVSRIGRLGSVAAYLLATLLVGVLAVRVGCPSPSEVPASQGGGVSGGGEAASGEAGGAGAVVRPDLFPEARRRSEESTYLTFPEWYIVYSSEEYGRWLGSERPSGFPYFRSIAQYWCGYNAVFELARKRYPFNAGNHLMLMVIGGSYTVEFAIKGVYENSVGRLTEAVSDGGQTEEDRLAREVAQHYGAFLNEIPWYRYPFTERLGYLWRETGLWGTHPGQTARKWERKLALSAEYGGKAVYGWLLGLATGAVYDEDAAQVLVWAEDLSVPAGATGNPATIRMERPVDGRSAVLVLPRFTAFRDTLLALPPGQGRLLAVAGNDEIMVTVLAPRDWRYALAEGQAVFEQEVLTEPERKRVAVRVPVPALLGVLAQLREQGLTVEHVYDY